MESTDFASASVTSASDTYGTGTGAKGTGVSGRSTTASGYRSGTGTTDSRAAALGAASYWSTESKARAAGPGGTAPGYGTGYTITGAGSITVSLTTAHAALTTRASLTEETA